MSEMSKMSWEEEAKIFDINFKEAMDKSHALPDGLQVGKIIQKGVGDGYAYYEITKIFKKTVHLKWREDLSCDGYIDAVLVNGGPTPIQMVEGLVSMADGWLKMFGQSAEK